MTNKINYAKTNTLPDKIEIKKLVSFIKNINKNNIKYQKLEWATFDVETCNNSKIFNVTFLTGKYTGRNFSLQYEDSEAYSLKIGNYISNSIEYVEHTESGLEINDYASPADLQRFNKLNPSKVSNEILRKKRDFINALIYNSAKAKLDSDKFNQIEI